MKKLLACILVLLLSFSAIFASGAKEETRTLTVWATPICNDIENSFTEIINEFEKSHPGVIVEFEEVSWSGVTEKLEIALRTGSTPDIFIDGTARTAKLPKTGLIVPVDDIINNFDGWSINALKIGKIDGINYLVPVTLMPPSFISINTTLAKELGVYELLPYDHESWSIEEFYNFIKSGTEAGKEQGVYGIGLYAASQSSDINTFSYMMSLGGKLLNEDKTECIINSPENVLALQVLKDLNDKGYVYPGVVTLKDEDTLSLSLNGKILINWCYSGIDLTNFNKESLIDGSFDKEYIFESYAFPTIDGIGHMVSGSWGANCLAIFENDGSNVELAKDFTRTFIENEAWFDSFYQMQPIYNPARGNYILRTNDDVIREDVERISEFSQYSISDFGILEEYWGEIRQQFYPKLQAVFSGDMTVQTALDAVKENVDKILDKYN